MRAVFVRIIKLLMTSVKEMGRSSALITSRYKIMLTPAGKKSSAILSINAPQISLIYFSLTTPVQRSTVKINMPKSGGGKGMPKKAIIFVLIHCKVKSKAKPCNRVVAVIRVPSKLSVSTPSLHNFVPPCYAALLKSLIFLFLYVYHTTKNLKVKDLIKKSKQII